jgi:hypothetical protein
MRLTMGGFNTATSCSMAGFESSTTSSSSITTARLSVAVWGSCWSFCTGCVGSRPSGSILEISGDVSGGFWIKSYASSLVDMTSNILGFVTIKSVGIRRFAARFDANNGLQRKNVKTPVKILQRHVSRLGFLTDPRFSRRLKTLLPSGQARGRLLASNTKEGAVVKVASFVEVKMLLIQFVVR